MKRQSLTKKSSTVLAAKLASVSLGVLVILIMVVLTSCEKSSTKRILFTGDLLLDRGVRDKIERSGIESLFHPSIDSLFSHADFVVSNLECPATTLVQPVNKQFIFRAEPEWLKTLRAHGITHLNMANNHSMDQGRHGLEDTYAKILSYDLHPLGYGQTHEAACLPHLITATPFPVFLYSTSLIPSENWAFLENQTSICEQSAKQIAEHIQVLKSKDPNAKIIVQLHWGVEHTENAHFTQVAEARTLIDAGADLVLGHHTHTLQNVQTYKGKPIYYSLGNFIFDQSKPLNARGGILDIQLSDTGMVFKLHEILIEQCVPILR